MPPESIQNIRVSVWRGDAGGGEFEQFDVPQQPSQTILDVVTWIQRHVDSSLSYRFACRVGMCGSCAMMVNGVPRWTCRTHVNKVMRDNQLCIEPLRNLPVIKDLACDMLEFFAKWQRAEGRFVGRDSRHQPVAGISPESTGVPSTVPMLAYCPATETPAGAVQVKVSVGSRLGIGPSAQTIGPS